MLTGTQRVVRAAKLLAWSKFLAPGVDALEVINVVLVAEPDPRPPCELRDETAYFR